MRDRDGQKEFNSGRRKERLEPEGRIDGVHSSNGGFGPISRFISKISKAPDSTGISVRSNEKPVLDKTRLEPIDETSPKMRMAGPEAEKQEVSNICKDIELLRDIDVSKVNDLAWKEITEFINTSMDYSEKEIEIYSRKRENAYDPNDSRMPQFDNVDRPIHYAAGSIECIDAIEAQLSAEEFRGYLKGNIIKYLWREKHKGGVESLKKAKWYLNKLLG